MKGKKLKKNLKWVLGLHVHPELTLDVSGIPLEGRPEKDSPILRTGIGIA